MDTLVISGIVFACLFAGAVLGLVLRAALSSYQLSADAKEVVKLEMGLIGTMAALLLALLVASAKSSYDVERDEITQMSAKIIFLDRLLANYGPQTTEAREQLRLTVARTLDQIWPQARSPSPPVDPTAAEAELVYRLIQQLSPANDAQRSLQSQALNLAVDLRQLRWLLFVQAAEAIPHAFLVVVIFWLTMIFASFGLLAPPNATILVTLLLCAVSVSGSIFLILELEHSFDGLIQISSAPMRNAMAHLGK